MGADNCTIKGPDSFLLSDGCKLQDVTTNRLFPFSSWCEHPGMVARARDMKGGVPSLPLLCELAPRCPQSVMEGRLAQTCCSGNRFSQKLGPWGGKIDGVAAV